MLLLRSLLWMLVAPGTVLGWVPLGILTATHARFDHGVGRWLGLVLLLAGAAGLIWCVWDFGRVGEGTLSPVDSPKCLVRGGLYHYIRNPMYVSVLTALVGEAVFFHSWWLVAWVAVVFTGFCVVVLRFEEPRLVRQFGETYEEYRRTVPRWLPRRLGRPAR